MHSDSPTPTILTASHTSQALTSTTELTAQRVTGRTTGAWPIAYQSASR
ncbi:hypothetical protein M2244_002286 [Rhodoferax antarcticus]|nr:hypothetical protein [Rhodoferax antarcticus]